MIRGNDGLIPARAGTTLDRLSSSPVRGAHPRSRGDHSISRFTIAFSGGSSPLARGPLLRRKRDDLSHGLIPARAGTTLAVTVLPKFIRAHPRSRGDHNRPPTAAKNSPGSSPLARGPPNTRPSRRELVGLIPARAGTTPPRRQTVRATRAHPRSRGDHLAFA